MKDRKDVFISYHTKSSAGDVEKICTALESAGIHCWYAPRDVEGDYATSIVKAIDACRVFLVILNRSSDVSEDVRNEINCAYERFRNHEDITLLPFKTDDYKLSAAVAYYLGRIHIMDGGIPPEMLKIRELVDRISMILGRKAELSFIIANERESKTYRLTGSAVCADAKFVGRSRELAGIYDDIHNRCNKLFLVGMGGIGKSELIRKYVQIHKNEYSLVVWIPFQNSLMETINNDALFEIHGICRKDFPEDSDKEYFNRKLRILRQITNEKVLLVVDNFDVDGDPELDEFLKGEYAVLFSTRNHQHHPYVSQVEINEIVELEELRSIFYSEYTKTVDLEGSRKVDEILELLCGHPLSIRLVAAAMYSRRLSPEKMLALLKSGKEEMMRNNLRAAEMIYGHLERIFKVSDLSENEKSIMCSLACLHINGISVEELFDRCEMDDFDIIDSLIDKNWVIHNPASDEVHLHPRIAELMRGEIAADTSRVLPLIQSIRENARNHQNMTFKDRSRLSEYVKHLYSLKLEDSYIRFVATVSLGYMSEGMNRQRGIDLFIEALEYAKDFNDRMECFVKISHNYTLNEQFEKGLEYARLGCAELEKEGVDDNPPGLYRNKMWCRVAEALYYLGKYEESIEYLEKAIELCEKYDVHNKGWTYYHLASASMRSGNIERAIRVAEQAKDIFTACKDHWSVAHCSILKSKIKQFAGDMDLALNYQKEAVDKFLKLYGQEEYTFSPLYFRLGYLLRVNGKPEEAMNYFESAHSIALKYNCFKKAEKIEAYINDPNWMKPMELL